MLFVYLPKIAFHMAERCCYINTVTVTTAVLSQLHEKRDLISLSPFHRRATLLSLNLDALLRGACAANALQTHCRPRPHYYTFKL